MTTLSQTQFLKTLPKQIIPRLPEALQGIKVAQPYRWLIQLHYGESRLHYEVSSAKYQSGWEIGFHCESSDRNLNRYLLKGFRQHLFEIKDTLGSSIEAEMWDKGWTKIYEIYPIEGMSNEHQRAVGERIAQIISCIQPIFAELRSEVQKFHR